MTSKSSLSWMVFILTCCITLKATTGEIPCTAGFDDNLYRLVSMKDRGNLLISTFNIRKMLSVLYIGSAGKTEELLRSKLDLVNQTNTLSDYKNILPNKDSPRPLKVASKIYAADSLKLVNKFKTDALVSFDTDVETTRFNDPKAAAEEINKWVSAKTVYDIKSIISPEALTPATRIILLNALHFHTLWDKPFTWILEKQKFYTAGNDMIDAKMIKTQGIFDYVMDTKRGFQFVRIPYEGGRFSLTILLPNEKKDLENIEATLYATEHKTRLVVTELHQVDYHQQIEITIPQFLIEKEISLKGILGEAGLGDIFSNAELPNMVSSEGALAIDDVRQNLKFEVSVFGTIASDSTSSKGSIKLAVPMMGAGEERKRKVDVYFTADHPFLYFLEMNIGKKRHVILQGRVVKPEF